MKPRTNEEKKLVEWSNNFPELTQRQSQYAIRHIFDDDLLFGVRGWFYRPKTNTCWKGTSIKDVHNCEKLKSPLHTDNKELKVIHCSNKVDKAYYVVLTTKGGYQAARWFLVTQTVHVDWKPYVRHQIDYSFKAVGVEWMNSEGKSWSVELGRFTMNPWCKDQWNSCGDLELRKYDFFIHYLDPNEVFIQNLLPVVRRNGFNAKALYNKFGFLLLRALVVDSDFESWYKCGHYGACVHWLKEHYMNLETRYYKKPAITNDDRLIIKMANRNHIKFATIEQWSDMKDYYRDLVTLGKDVHNPTVLFPKDFQKVHQTIARRAQKRRDEDARRAAEHRHLQEMVRRGNNEKVKEWLERYFQMFHDMCIVKGDFMIIPLLTQKDFSDEAAWMHHCIVTYYGKKDTLLVSISRHGVKQETAEVCLNGKPHVVQCRGIHNHPSEYHDEIMKFLNDNMKEFVRRYKSKPKQQVMLPVPASFYQYKIAV